MPRIAYGVTLKNFLQTFFSAGSEEKRSGFLLDEIKRAVLVFNKRNVTKNIYTFMVNLDLGQSVANKKETKKIDSCSYSGQILSAIASCKSASLRFSY